MVYINARGEVVDENSATAANIFWKIITFISLFFKSLVGIEDRPLKKSDDRPGKSGSLSGGGGGGGGFYGGGGGGGPSNSDSKGPRKFGPRGFKSITDLPPPPPPMGCSGGSCG